MSNEDDKRDLIIKAFFQPTERTCIFCNETFKGFKKWCDKEDCRKTGPLYVEYNCSLWQRPLDYVSTARKTFLVENLPGEKHPNDPPKDAVESEELKEGLAALEDLSSRLKNTNK